MTRFGTLANHLRTLRAALDDLAAHESRIERWGVELARVFAAGGRLLAAGNGGSAAEAQHLTAELVGRFETAGRAPLSAIALHADTSSGTAIANDFGVEEVFARQVRAHGRPGDVLVLLTTSGRSATLLAAAHTARSVGVTVWAITGPAPNALAHLADDTIDIGIDSPTAVQEAHLVAVHALCAALERHVDDGGALRQSTPHAGDDVIIDLRTPGPAFSQVSHHRGVPS